MEQEKVPSIVEQLPTPISLPLADLFRDARARSVIALYRLADAAETITRFVVAVALCDLRRRGFSEQLRNALSARFERPSFGIWLDLGGKVIDELGNGCLLPRLPAFWRSVWRPLLDGDKGLVRFRNNLVHGGCPKETWAANQMDLLLPDFDRALEQLSFLSEVRLLAVDAEGRIRLLQGQHPRILNEPGLALSPRRLYLAVPDETLDLFPLQAYDAVLGGRDSLSPAPPSEELVPLLYQRFQEGRRILEFTACAGSLPIGRARADVVDGFLAAFDLRGWRPLDEPDTRISSQRYDFSEILRDLDDGFIGRDEQLDQVEAWVAQNERAGGTLWITGEAGVGKSAFMAGLVRRFKKSEPTLVVPYFFRAADARCSDESFYEAAVLLVSGRLPVEPIQQAGESLLDRLRRALDLVEPTKSSVLFILDGLDELSSPRALIETVATLQRPGVVWILAGRVNARPTGESVECLWPDGLPRLTSNDVRAYLLEEIAARRYDVLARDRPEGNAFIEAVVERSAGLPLYLRMGAEDLRSGRISPEREVDLPVGLVSYFENQLSRLSVGIVTQLLTDMLAVLARALDPLSIDTLTKILSLKYGPDDEWRAFLEEAVSQGQAFLTWAPIPGGGRGLRIFHEAFREHLEAAPTMRLPLRSGFELLLQWCAQAWREGESYALSHVARHLAGSRRYSELIDLLRDDFLEARTAVSFVRAMPDLRLGLEAARALDDRGAALRLTLAHARLERQNLSQVDAELIPLYARFGELPYALELTDALTDTTLRAEVMLGIAIEVKASNPAEAEALAARGLGALAGSSVHDKTAELLRRACEPFPQVFADAVASLQVFEPLFYLGALDDEPFSFLTGVLSNGDGHITGRLLCVLEQALDLPGDDSRKESLRFFLVCTHPDLDKVESYVGCEAARLVVQARRQVALSGEVEVTLAESALRLVLDDVGRRDHGLLRHAFVPCTSRARLPLELVRRSCNDFGERFAATAFLLRVARAALADAGDFETASSLLDEATALNATPIDGMRALGGGGCPPGFALLIATMVRAALHRGFEEAFDFLSLTEARFGLIDGQALYWQVFEEGGARDFERALERAVTPLQKAALAAGVARRDLRRAVDVWRAIEEDCEHRRVWLRRIVANAGQNDCALALTVLRQELLRPQFVPKSGLSRALLRVAGRMSDRAAARALGAEALELARSTLGSESDFDKYRRESLIAGLVLAAIDSELWGVVDDLIFGLADGPRGLVVALVATFRAATMSKQGPGSALIEALASVRSSQRDDIRSWALSERLSTEYRRVGEQWLHYDVSRLFGRRLLIARREKTFVERGLLDALLGVVLCSVDPAGSLAHLDSVRDKTLRDLGEVASLRVRPLEQLESLEDRVPDGLLRELARAICGRRLFDANIDRGGAMLRRAVQQAVEAPLPTGDPHFGLDLLEEILRLLPDDWASERESLGLHIAQQAVEHKGCAYRAYGLPPLGFKLPDPWGQWAHDCTQEYLEAFRRPTPLDTSEDWKHTQDAFHHYASAALLEVCRFTALSDPEFTLRLAHEAREHAEQIGETTTRQSLCHELSRVLARVDTPQTWHEAVDIAVRNGVVDEALDALVEGALDASPSLQSSVLGLLQAVATGP